jgi:hypothetical protein
MMDSMGLKWLVEPVINEASYTPLWDVSELSEG